MSEPQAPGNALALELRAAFDRSFAIEAVAAQEHHEEILAIQVGGRPLALRARETAGISRCPALSFMPSRNASLCGLAGIRGTLVAVYSVAGLLGMSTSPLAQGWIALCAADPSVALLFEELDGYARVGSNEILASDSTSDLTSQGKQVIRIGGSNRGLLALPDLLDTINRTTESR